jgi:hypothetical protein
MKTPLRKDHQIIDPAVWELPYQIEQICDHCGWFKDVAGENCKSTSQTWLFFNNLEARQ